MQAVLYHTHHTQDLEDLPFWLDLARQAGGPILELGCGTGRIMLPLIQAGHKVTGLDLSSEMLNYLKTVAAQAGIESPDVIQADLTEFQLNKQFPLIILPCNTYSTLSAEQRRDALACISRHLASGGVFAASMPNPEWLTELEEDDEIEIETVFIHPETGNPVQASNEWRRIGGQLEICWYYDHLLPDGQVKRDTQATRHWLFPPEEYITELENLGFRVEAYGSFEKDSFSQDMPFLIFTAHQK